MGEFSPATKDYSTTLIKIFKKLRQIKMHLDLTSHQLQSVRFSLIYSLKQN